MGTLQQISALMVGEMWGIRFMNALLAEENMGTSVLFNWEETGKMVEENEKVNPIFFCLLLNRSSVKYLYIFVGRRIEVVSLKYRLSQLSHLFCF